MLSFKALREDFIASTDCLCFVILNSQRNFPCPKPFEIDFRNENAKEERTNHLSGNQEIKRAFPFNKSCSLTLGLMIEETGERAKETVERLLEAAHLQQVSVINHNF